MLMLALLALVAVVAAGFSPKEAFAVDYVLGNQTSCEAAPFSGTWEGTTNACTITLLSVSENDTVTIALGITLNIDELDNEGEIINNGEIVVIDSPSSFDNHNVFTNNGNFTNGGTTVNWDDGTLTNDGRVINDATLTNEGTINNTGDLFNNDLLNNSGTIDNSGDLSNSGTGDFVNSGTVNNNAGSFLSNSGETVNDGDIVSDGSVTIDDGDVFNNGTFTINESLTIDANAVFTNDGSITIFGEIVNDGEFVNNNDIFVSNVLTNSGTGTINNNGGTINIDSATFTNAGNVTSNGIIENTGDIDNTGRIENDAGGTIDNLLGATIDNSGTLDNEGTINNKNDINNADTLTNSGFINNTSTISNTGDFTSSGNISSTFSIENTGTFTNAGTLYNGDSIRNNGDFTNSGTLTNDDSITNNNNSTFTNNGTLINQFSFLSIDSTVVNSGTVTNNATLTQSSGTYTNNGTIDNYDALTISASAVMTNNERIYNNATIRIFGLLNNTSSDTIENDCGGVINGNVTGIAAEDACAPSADAQAVTTDEDEDVLVNLTGSSHDADSDFAAIPLQFLVATRPSHGALTGSNSSLTYTPNANFAGSDSFAFVTNDGTNNSTAATVSITITAIEDAPVANAQSVTTAKDNSVAITLTGSDAEGSALTFNVVAQPGHGALSGTAPNLTYRPEDGFDGSDSFTFVANDGISNSTAATISITVEDDERGGNGGGGKRSVVVNGNDERSVDVFSERYFAENPLDRIGVSNSGLLDASGASIGSAAVGQSISIAGTFSNHQENAQDYTFIVQIIDDGGSVVHIVWQDGNIESGATAGISLPWTPEIAGDHTVKMFVWNGLQASPVPLSPVSAMNVEVEQ